MAIVGKYFPGQAPSERVFLVLRRSVFTYITFLAIALIMIVPLIVLFVFYLQFPDTFAADNINAGLTLAVSAYLLFILGLLLFGFVDYYLDVYIITDERIVDIKQIGFFKRAIAELHLREVQDVSAQVNGFFPTMFHFGDVIIQTAGERENFVFTAVPHPYQIAKKIADLHETQIERERLMEESNIRQQLSTPSPEETMDKEKEAVPKSESLIAEAGFREPDRPQEEIFSHYSENPEVDELLPEEKNSPEEEKPSETNIDEGLKKIDEFVQEETKENEELERKIELREGEIVDLDDKAK
jgi:uncharacterized membrane protein YdbT with pleckstrin-like domain